MEELKTMIAVLEPFFSDWGSESVNFSSQMVTFADVKLCLGDHFGAIDIVQVQI